MLLAEDASDCLQRIKEALNFSANLTGADKAGVNAVLKELNNHDGSMISYSRFNEIMKSAIHS